MRQVLYLGRILSTLILLALPCATIAQTPPAGVFANCLVFDTLFPSARMVWRFGNTSSIAVDYPEPGYRADIYDYKGMDFGYATGPDSSKGMVLFGSQSSPISKAIRVNGFEPETMEPTLADYGVFLHKGLKYLCVASNFDGIGRSGTFQNVRMAYVARIDRDTGKRTAPKLYHAVADIRKLNRQAKEGRPAYLAPAPCGKGCR